MNQVESDETTEDIEDLDENMTIREFKELALTITKAPFFLKFYMLNS